jgi:hypothetical protein
MSEGDDVGVIEEESEPSLPLMEDLLFHGLDGLIQTGGPLEFAYTKLSVTVCLSYTFRTDPKMVDHSFFAHLIATVGHFG